MFCQTDDESVAQLKKKLDELREIIANPDDPDEWDWAVMMFNLVRNDLEKLVGITDD